MAENLVKADPKAYFNFMACATCFHKPCERLRYGGVSPGKSIIVHSREYSFSNCYFATEAWDEIEVIFSNFQVHDFVYEIGRIITLMSPAEQLHWELRNFVTGYLDLAGYKAYLRRLWEERIVIVLRIPMFYQNDLKIRRWLHALEGGVELSHTLAVDDDLSSKAATDVLVGSEDKTSTKKDEVPFSTVIISLAIDPEDAENHNDLFVLESTDKSYIKSKTVKDDTVEGNDTLDLEYTDVKSDLTYNLFVDHGDHGGKQIYFENIQGKDLIKNVP